MFPAREHSAFSLAKIESSWLCWCPRVIIRVLVWDVNSNTERVMNMRILGYVRTSTDEQTNGTEAQRARLRQEAKERGWDLTIIEEHASGKTLARRPVLQNALKRLDAGEVDGLVVTKLDRLARSVIDFASILQRSSTNGWAFISLDLALDTSTPNGRFTAHVLAAVAQLERDLISQRTRESLAVVKSRGVQLGHPSTVTAKTSAKIVTLRDSGLGWRQIASKLDALGVAAPSGSAWSFSTVRQIYLRAA